MAIANMSRYFWADYYQGLILPTTAGENEQASKASNAVSRNKTIQETAFSCFTSEELSNEKRLSLWTTYPGVMMGTGYAHDGGLKGDICLGFSFDYVTGLPYLPGSSVKGVLRSAFEHPEYVQALLESETVDVAALERTIFGERPSDAMQETGNGKVTFLDAFPVKSCDADMVGAVKKYRLLELEAITPHHTGALGLLSEPTPLTLLKLRPGVKLCFRFLLPKTVCYGKGRCIEDEKVLTLFKAIILDLGVGAKTNVGFGNLAEEEPAASKPQSSSAGTKRQQAPARQAAPKQMFCRTCGKPTDINPKTGAPYPYCRECSRAYQQRINGGNSPQRR